MLSERGAALLEVMIATVVLATAGLALAGVVEAAINATIDMHERERRLAKAHQILVAMTLLDHRDLTLRLGRRVIGDFAVTVQRPEPALFRVAVADSTTGALEHVVTVVYRPDPERALGARRADRP